MAEIRPRSIATFTFQPPAGGDVVLRSCDGSIFNIHSVLLGLSSTVFAGMFSGASTPDTIELAEDAETISLMLAFMYPVTPPPITTVDQLEKVMLFSQKYDITKMIEYVQQAVRPESELVHSDPIRLFRASTKYDFPTIKLLSARAFYPKHCNVFTPSELAKLSQHFPEASSAIGLIHAQMARTSAIPKIVAEATGSMAPRCNRSHSSGSDDHLPYMACRKCWDKSRPYKFAQYTPGWLWNWSKQVRSRLIQEPMYKCEDLFTIVYFTDHSRWPFGRSGCSDCVAQTLTRRSMFEEWAQGIKKYIEKEVEELAKLYPL